MRININRMRGSLAHKVGSGQAVFRPDGILARHTLPKLLPTSKAGPFSPGWHFGQENLEEMPKISPAEANGGIVVHSRKAKWKFRLTQDADRLLSPRI
jgi:hypothetical protein